MITEKELDTAMADTGTRDVVRGMISYSNGEHTYVAQEPFRVMTFDDPVEATQAWLGAIRMEFGAVMFPQDLDYTELCSEPDCERDHISSGFVVKIYQHTLILEPNHEETS